MRQLILASGSPRRRELLALLGLPFEVKAAEVPEDAHPGEAPATLAVRLAQAKAEAVRVLSCQGAAACSIVIGCDTVVALDGEVLGKPADGIEATAVLQRLRGRAHEVYSAVAVLNGAASASAVIEVARTFVRMRCYCDTEVAAYVATGDPLDKAGAYAIQNAEFQPVSECLGCYTNVMGLPLCHLARSLHAWSVELANDVPRACQVHTHRLCTVYNDILRD